MTKTMDLLHFFHNFFSTWRSGQKINNDLVNSHFIIIKPRFLAKLSILKEWFFELKRTKILMTFFFTWTGYLQRYCRTWWWWDELWRLVCPLERILLWQRHSKIVRKHTKHWGGWTEHNLPSLLQPIQFWGIQ